MATLTGLIDAYVNERKALREFRGQSPKVVKDRLRSLDRSFGNRPIGQLGQKAIVRWITDNPQWTVGSHCSYLSSARGFTSWLTTRGILTVDPCKGIPNPTRPRAVPRAFAHAEVAASLDACRDDRDRVVIWLAVGMGLRRGEIARLHWPDYDDRARILRVKGKGDNERIVTVPKAVAAALDRIRLTAGPVIRSKHDGRAITPNAVWAIVNRILRDAGVKQRSYDGRSIHAFRHTAASDVLDECGDLRTVQAMLGHTSLTSTQIYLRAANLGDMRTAMEGRDYGGLDEPPAAA